MLSTIFSVKTHGLDLEKSIPLTAMKIYKRMAHECTLQKMGHALPLLQTT